MSKPGMHADGAGLYLQVGPTGAKSWIFRYMMQGQARAMGLGPLHTVSLAEAREAALAARKLRLAGRDPIEARDQERSAARAREVSTITFKAAAEACMDALEAGWRNAKHQQQWRNTLATYAYPVMGDLSVEAIEVSHVMAALDPIWRVKPETASRVRMRLEAVLDWARARGYRHGENPARWRGHLDHLLPARSKVRRVEHHAALPYREVPAFVGRLRTMDGVSAAAFEFLILTATRTSEALGARWSEIDVDGHVWTIPADRMKAGREHRVPLSDGAGAVVGRMQRTRTGEYVFPGARPGHPLSNMALLMLLKRMGRGDLTAHGFRSSFRDWAAEQTDYPREVAEMALAHSVGDKVEAAYRRGDLLERRGGLMRDWAAYCTLGAQRA